jgi:hypothetical protein
MNLPRYALIAGKLYRHSMDQIEHYAAFAFEASEDSNEN